jgi:hypothetical protein
MTEKYMLVSDIKNYPISLNSSQSNIQKDFLLKSNPEKGSPIRSVLCAQDWSSVLLTNVMEEEPDFASNRTFLSSPTTISHSMFKTETFILNTTKMWHRAQARHLFQQNVMFW